MTEFRTIRPGVLISVKTSHAGNRSYQKKEIERPHRTDDGVERSRWDTVRIVFDPDEAKEAYAKRRVPLRRYGAAEEVAHMTLSLCLPASSFVNGAIIPVDGGMTIRHT